MSTLVPTANPWAGLRPPYLAALALWGWQQDLMLPAIAMGLLLELPRVVRARVDIAQPDFDRLWSLTSVLFLAVVFYLLLARQGMGVAAGFLGGGGGGAEQDQDNMRRVSGTALTFLRWFPFVLFPFTMAFTWSRSLSLPWSTFSLYEQARAKRAPHIAPPEWAVKQMHPGYLYVGVTLFTATTASVHLDAFLPLLMAVIVLTLWPWRGRRYGVVTWCIMAPLLLGIAVASRYGHLAARDAWQAMEGRMGAFGTSAPNPNQSKRATAIGEVGRVKQSSAIQLWVRTADEHEPGLLREAAFNRYRNGVWNTVHQTFQPVDQEHLSPAPGPGDIAVTRYTFNSEAPLAVPGGVARMRTTPPAGIEVSSFAALRLHSAPELATYVAERPGDPHAGLDAPPEPDDTSLVLLNDAERTALEAAGREAGLPGATPAEAVARITAYFGHGFSYSLWQGSRLDGGSPLVDFLRTTRAGHCEYYATATALVLRTAGVPTRYAVGYSPAEIQGDAWIARGRDAHAWCLAWVDGAWRDVDTTPGIWRGTESATAPWYESLQDRWTQAWYRFTLWKQNGGNWRLVVFIAGMLVLVWIGWRQIRGSAWRRSAAPDPAAVAATIPGLDSEFFAVLQRLAALHGERLPHETPRAWLRRLGLADDGPGLAEALALHQRLRFAPDGLAPGERARLRELAGRLSASLAPTTPAGTPRS